jgi:hypothetical protein
MTWTEKTTLTCHWKGYDDGWYITEKATLMWTEKATLTCHWKAYTNVSLKRLWWQVTYYWNCYPDMNWKSYSDMSLKRHPNVNWKAYSDISLKRLQWWVTYHWKSYDDVWHITEKATLAWTEKPIQRCHWKGYPNVNWKAYSDMSLKRLPWCELKSLLWHITVKATMTGNISLKRLWWRMTYHWKWYPNVN